MIFPLLKGLANHSQTLTKYHQKLCYFWDLPLKPNPQKDWQTLKNFDYPNKGIMAQMSATRTQ
jgi:hypothetical protein